MSPTKNGEITLRRDIFDSPEFALFNQRSWDQSAVCNDIQDLDNCERLSRHFFQSNKWHKIVISFYGSNRSNGWIKFWLDGKLIHSYEGRTLYNYKPHASSFRVGIYRKRASHAQSVDVDNFIVSRELESVLDFLDLDPSKFH